MGTSQQQQSFDIQKLFKSSSPSPTGPSPTPPGYNPYPHSHPANPFPPQPSYPPPTSSFPSGMYPYLHYPQEQHHPRPASYSPGAAFPQAPPPYQPAIAPLPTSSAIASPPLDGARLMALLTTHSTGDLRESLELPPAALPPSSGAAVEAPELAAPAPPAIAPALPTAPPVSLAPPGPVVKSPGRVAKGRVLAGDRVVCEVSVGKAEENPQLEVSTITVYSSDPAPPLGRQIAVNKTYICYGLRAGTIRVLNINTASRSLSKGHTVRVVDMAFVSNDVHILASSSAEGRVYVRKILEGEQITDQIIVGIHFTGDWNSAEPRVEPRVCWHSRQDLLIVGVGKYVLTVDTRNKHRANEDPVECNVKKPIEGVTLLGSHQGDVTGLAMCPGTNRFASSSKDGTVRLWAETEELAVLAPHEMEPVYSVNFIPAPRNDHFVMVTGGPLNRELKLFSPAGADGLNSMCIQTLLLTSSGPETKPEDEFFNQSLAVPGAGLLLLANTKKNAIYAVHLEFGQLASATRMDFLAEFSVKMPILTFTATSDNLVDGEGIIQLYAIQTQAIQQHALDTAMCLPPAQELPESFTTGVPSKVAEKPGVKDLVAKDSEAEKSKAFGESFPEEKLDSVADQIDKGMLPDDVLEKPAEVKTEVNDEEKKASKHLITPSDLMSMVARSKSEASSSSAAANVDDEEDSREVGEAPEMIDGFDDRKLIDSCDAILDILESGDPDEADALIDSYTSHAFPEPELEERSMAMAGSDDISVSELKEVPVKGSEASAAVSQSPAVSKGRKNKNKASAGAPLSSVASSSVGPPEAEASGAPVGSEGLAAQVQAMQESLNQLVVLHKDMQKQFSMATVPMAKRMETTLGQRLEKIIKANVEALLAKIQEENVKREKAERERAQQVLAAMAASTKELPAAVERIVKKELGAMGPSVAKLLSPAIEKAVSGGLADSQALSDKAIPQLEKAVTSKLEGVVARHLQAQFQTTGRQALQEAMRACFEASVVPSFERSCKSMFDQVDSSFQKGMTEHVTHTRQQSSASEAAIISGFQESVNSLAQTLKAELAENHRKQLTAITETRLKSANAPEKVLAMSLQHVEAALDPTIELSRLVAQGKLEDAFNKALSLSDVSIVSWLCNQVDPAQVFSTTPLPLSQGVLLSLIQQLGYDLATDTAKKLPWIQGAALALNPNDPMLSGHMKVFLEQLYQNLHRLLMITSGPSELTSPLKLVLHLVNSLLSSCK